MGAETGLMNQTSKDEVAKVNSACGRRYSGAQDEARVAAPREDARGDVAAEPVQADVHARGPEPQVSQDDFVEEARQHRLREAAPMVEGMRAQVEAVREALRAASDGVPIHLKICFVAADWLPSHARFKWVPCR